LHVASTIKQIYINECYRDMKIWTLTVLIVAFIAILFYSFRFKNIETPKYRVLKTFGDVEIREYPEMILAQTSLNKSDYDSEGSNGFRTVAGYIFGGNQTQQKIAMTAPVIMNMGDSASMSFVMPSEYAMNDLPAPASNKVKLVKQQAKILAVIRFGGYSNSSKIKDFGDQLMATLKANNIEFTGPLMYMGYNAPWDVVNRRNEVGVTLVVTPTIGRPQGPTQQ